MGSGSSTAQRREPKQRVESKISHVANVNNSVKQVSPEHPKTRTTEETEKVTVSRASPVFPKKQNSVEKVTHERGPQTNSRNKSVTKSIKSVEKLEWESDSNFDDDDWDDFLGTTRTQELPVQKRYNDRVKELNSYNEKKSEEQYPETYAQKHTRQQYTFGQDRLIREKTIYRNPDEWNGHHDEEEEEEEPNLGFDASRFRAANQGKSSRDQQLFSARDEFETPTYLKNREPPDVVPKISNETFQTKELPTYSKEEEDLMKQLLMGGDMEPTVHQDTNRRYGSSLQSEDSEPSRFHQEVTPARSKLQKSNDFDQDFIGHQSMNYARSKMRMSNDFDHEPIAHQAMNHARSKMRMANDLDLELIGHQAMDSAH